MGVRALPRIAAAAGRRRPRAGRARGDRRARARCPASASCAATLARRSPSAPPRRASRPPSITVVGAGRRAGRASSPGCARRARWPARRSRSRAPARRRARWRRGCARSAPHVVEAPGDPHRAARPRRCPTWPASTSLLRPRPNGVEQLFAARRRARRAGAGRARRRRDRPRHRRARCASTASSADVVPERSVAESLVEALARRAGAPRADRPRARRRATCCPTRCARAARRSRCSPSTHRRRAARRRARGARAGRRLRDVHLAPRRVRFFAAAAPAALGGPRLVSIGPVTSAALRELGLEPRRRGRRRTRPTGWSPRCWPTSPRSGARRRPPGPRGSARARRLVLRRCRGARSSWGSGGASSSGSASGTPSGAGSSSSVGQARRGLVERDGLQVRHGLRATRVGPGARLAP